MASTHLRLAVRLLLLTGAIQAAAGVAGQERQPVGACPASRDAARPWLDTALSAECRADALVARLVTPEDKLAALGDGLARFGLTDAVMSDGPSGMTHADGALSLPNGLALAAGFDPSLADRYGAVLGREARAAGVGRLLGPTVDIARTWRAGRTPEGLGEDPMLAASLAAPLVRGVQRQGVAVTLKHFAAYTQEQGRIGDQPLGVGPAVDSRLSERTLREIYLPPFRAAVEQGDALGVMCAFPRVNGTPACENALLLGILKKEWGFRGIVLPDFPDAQRSVVAAVNAGLDNGRFGLPGKGPVMVPPPAGGGGPPPPSAFAPVGPPAGGPPAGSPPGGAVPGGVDLKTALAKGLVSPARVDDMVRRRLVALFATGGGEPRAPMPARLADADAQALALRVAEAGAVLLRNQNGLLPFGRDVRTIAVIGTQAGPRPQVSTPGSAFVAPKHLTSALDAIRRRATGATVSFTPGSVDPGALPAVPVAVLRTADGAPGLRAEYVAGGTLDFSGKTIAVRTEPGVALVGPAPIAGLPDRAAWSTRWTGRLTPRKDGLHLFSIAGAGSARLILDGVTVAHYDGVDFGAVTQVAVPLCKGRAVDLRVEFTPRGAAPMPPMQVMGTAIGTTVQLGWSEPDARIARAVEAARAADVAVVFAADRHGEGADRTTLSLPGDQDALIAAVAAANPRTVVVLSTAGPVAMPWARDVGAILEMWYAGDAFGAATGRLLFGDADPAGRLPITFPASEGQGPATTAAAFPGIEDASGAPTARFDEELLVGYRWFDARAQQPLFPFGFGLGYAPLTVDGISAAPRGQGAVVRATVRNPGTRSGTETVQVYLGFPAAAGEPPQRLAAYRKVTLAPGATQAIEIALPPAAFELWDEGASRWASPSGAYRVIVGRSSRDVLASTTIRR